MRHMSLSQSHQLLGTLLQLSLTSVQISVNIEVDLLSESPKADILLLRREGEAWSAAQRARLPDGVRDSLAGHVLLEFKYTESVNETALAQAVAYDYFYRQAQKLPEEQVLTVVLSAKTPRTQRLEEWGYTEEQKGVFRSHLPLLRRVWLLVLNDLPSQPHNAYVKLFASREREREAAFAALDAPVVAESPRLQVYMVGLQRALDVKGEIEMAEVLTPEKVMEIGEKVRQRILELATPDEIDDTLRQRILEMATPDEIDDTLRQRILEMATPDEIDDTLRQRILEMATPEERLIGLDPNTIDDTLRQRILELATPEERLAGMSAAERRTLLRLLQENMDADTGEAENRDNETT